LALAPSILKNIKPLLKRLNGCFRSKLVYALLRQGEEILNMPTRKLLKKAMPMRIRKNQ